MTLSIALVVLAAAFFHASWNTILKAQPDHAAGYIIMLTVTSLLSGIGVLYYGPPPDESWIYLAMSVVLHVAYNYLLVCCYRLADISLIYPVLRGAAPPLAVLAGFLWLAETPPLSIIAGVLLVSVGILCMAGGSRGSGKAFVLALLTASVIAAYSVVDAAGARLTGNAVQYSCWLSVFDAPLFILLMMLTGFNKRRLLGTLQWRYLLLAVVGGGLTLLAYVLVVYAYTMAQVGAVAALRETSVIFGVLAGKFFLGEPKARGRAIGSLVIAAGAAVIVINSQ